MIDTRQVLVMLWALHATKLSKGRAAQELAASHTLKQTLTSMCLRATCSMSRVLMTDPLLGLRNANAAFISCAVGFWMPALPLGLLPFLPFLAPWVVLLAEYHLLDPLEADDSLAFCSAAYWNAQQLLEAADLHMTTDYAQKVNLLMPSLT